VSPKHHPHRHFATVISVNGEAQRASDPRLLSAKIKERALGEGFCQVGIVPAEALGDERARHLGHLPVEAGL